MNRRVSLGAFSTDAAVSRAVTLRKLGSLPPLPSGAIFKPCDIAEPALNKLTLFERGFFTFCTAIVFVSAAVLLFV